MGLLPGDWRGLATWYACQQPERRPDAFTGFHPKCNGCAIAYEAQQAPPPPGEFTGWYDSWSPTVLASMRVGDIEQMRTELGCQPSPLEATRLPSGAPGRRTEVQ